jgi:hypothetical protein
VNNPSAPRHLLDIPQPPDIYWTNAFGKKKFINYKTAMAPFKNNNYSLVVRT